MRLVPLVFLAALLTPPDFAAKADAYMRAWADAKRFSGAVLVAVDGKPAFRKAYGYADWPKRTPMTLDTPVMLFSISKGFDAACVLLLQDRGLLNVQDPVGRHLDGWPAAWNGVTLHHLLTHSSGLDSESLHGWLEDPKSPVKPPQTKPGERYAYSNMGYVVLSRVVEKVGGAPYGEFLRRTVFGPLGMAHSGTGGYADGARDVARGHFLDGTVYQPFDQTTDEIVGAGDVHATVDDMLRWRLALDRPGFLSDAARKAMFTPWIATGQGAASYGYGWEVDRETGDTGHTGGGASSCTSIETFPNGRITVVVLRNLSPDLLYLPVYDLADLARGKAVPLPRFVDLEEGDRYQGVYGTGFPTLIAMRNGALQASYPNGIVWDLEPLGGRRFKAHDDTMEFIPHGTGWTLKTVGDGETTLDARVDLAPALLDTLAGTYANGPVTLKVVRKGARLAATLPFGSLEFVPTARDRFRALTVDTKLLFLREKGRIVGAKLVGNGQTFAVTRKRS